MMSYLAAIHGIICDNEDIYIFIEGVANIASIVFICNFN